jgi:prophage regulatory protein
MSERDGFLRIKDICGDRRAGIPPLIPVARSTVWAWVKAGKFPSPTKIGGRTTVWRASEIAAFVENGKTA